MKHITFLLSFCLFLMISCAEKCPNELQGVWRNNNEKCQIKFGKDFTFIADKLPLDVINAHAVEPGLKFSISGKGKYEVRKNIIRLNFTTGGWYEIDYKNASTLSLELNEESGGTIIKLNSIR